MVATACERGIAGLERPKRFGRPPKLDYAQRAELINAINAGAMAAGLPRASRCSSRGFGVKLSQPPLWRMLQQLGWNVQRCGSRERGEAAITERR
jgi:transposase